MLRMFTTQPTVHVKLNKKEGHSVDASNSLRMGNKIITGGRGRRSCVGKRRRRKEGRAKAGSGMGREG